MLEFFIAKKHIFERKRQSLITILGITIGILVLTVGIGISNGLNKNMIDSILSMTPHIVVYDTGEEGEYLELKENLKKEEGVIGVIPKLSTQGILKYKNEFINYANGVKIDGIDFDEASKTMPIAKKMEEGVFKPSKLTGVIIGSELFKEIGAKLGDEITIISSENKEIKFNIEGVFKSGYMDFDRSVVLIPLPAVQMMSESGDTITSLDVMLKDVHKAGEMNNSFQQKYGFFSRTWGDMNSNLLQALALEQNVLILLLSLLILIAGFVVWAILNMLVREKVKDIGIMRSMGFTSNNIMKIFLIEGLALGITGIILGTSLALALLWYVKNYSLPGVTDIYYLTKIPVEISKKEIGIITLGNLIVIFMSSVFPAFRASKMKPVEALRYE